MAEYIERETAIAWFMPYAHAGESIDADVVISDIKGMKTADVAPVVHGDFEKHPEEVILNLRVTPFLCKTCRTTFITLNKEGKRFMFCSYCGAKMDGGKDDENA